MSENISSRQRRVNPVVHFVPLTRPYLLCLQYEMTALMLDLVFLRYTTSDSNVEPMPYSQRIRQSAQSCCLQVRNSRNTFQFTHTMSSINHYATKTQSICFLYTYLGSKIQSLRVQTWPSRIGLDTPDLKFF